MIHERLEQIETRYEAIGALLLDPEIASDLKQRTALSKEQRSLEKIVVCYREYRSLFDQVAELKEMAKEADPDIAAMAEAELENALTRLPELEEKLKKMLIPKDPADEKNVIVEIRAGTGGDEAALFAADLARMYMRYAENHNWKTSIISQNEIGIGGYKEIIFEVKGHGAYSRLKYESGVHRVQRVPETEAMGRVIEKAVEAGLKDAARQPLAYEPPALDGEPAFELDSDFMFSVTYDAYPSFDLPSLDGIEIEVPSVAIADEDVAHELEDIRQRNAIVVDKDGPAETGDIVNANFVELAEDGSEVAGTARQDFSFELGKNLNIYKFDDEIVGLKAGDEKTFPKAFPADYEFSEYASKTVTIKVKVTKVKKQDLPDLDDELAQDVSEKYKTLEDLKAAVRSQLSESLEAKLRRTKENAIIDELLKRTKVSIPPSMLAAELAMRWESLKQQIGVDNDERMEMFLSLSGKTRDQLLQEWKPLAEKALSSRILLDKLIEAGAYSATDEEVDAEIAKEATRTTMSPAEIKAEYEKRGTIEYIKDDIKSRKFFDAALSSATVKEAAPVSYLDFMKKND